MRSACSASRCDWRTPCGPLRERPIPTITSSRNAAAQSARRVSAIASTRPSASPASGISTQTVPSCAVSRAPGALRATHRRTATVSVSSAAGPGVRPRTTTTLNGSSDVEAEAVGALAGAGVGAVRALDEGGDQLALEVVTRAQHGALAVELDGARGRAARHGDALELAELVLLADERHEAVDPIASGDGSDQAGPPPRQTELVDRRVGGRAPSAPPPSGAARRRCRAPRARCWAARRTRCAACRRRRSTPPPDRSPHRGGRRSRRCRSRSARAASAPSGAAVPGRAGRCAARRCSARRPAASR